MRAHLRRLGFALLIPALALPLLVGGAGTARAAADTTNYGHCSSVAAKGDGSNKAFTDENKPATSNGNQDEPPASCVKA